MPRRRLDAAGRLSLRFVIFALLLQAMLLLSAEKAGKLNFQGQTTKEVTITGEIVDVSCYVKMGALGVAQKSMAIRGRTYEKGGQLILEVLSVGKGK